MISTKEPVEGNVAEYDGLPSNEVKKVKDCNGYIQYSFISASGCRGTDAEKTEIENLLKSGINVITTGSGTNANTTGSGSNTNTSGSGSNEEGF